METLLRAGRKAPKFEWLQPLRLNLVDSKSGGNKSFMIVLMFERLELSKVTE
jgi:hypothetical protein